MTWVLCGLAVLWSLPLLAFTFLLVRFWRDERRPARSFRADATVRGVSHATPPPALRAVAPTPSIKETRRAWQRDGS